MPSTRLFVILSSYNITLLSSSLNLDQPLIESPQPGVLSIQLINHMEIQREELKTKLSLFTFKSVDDLLSPWKREIFMFSITPYKICRILHSLSNQWQFQEDDAFQFVRKLSRFTFSRGRNYQIREVKRNFDALTCNDKALKFINCYNDYFPSRNRKIIKLLNFSFSQIESEMQISAFGNLGCFELILSYKYTICQQLKLLLTEKQSSKYCDFISDYLTAIIQKIELINQIILILTMDQSHLRTFVQSHAHQQKTVSQYKNKDQILIELISDSDQQISEHQHHQSENIQQEPNLYLLGDFTKWINTHWQVLQLIATILILCILGSGLYLIYQSTAFPNLQFQNQTIKNSDSSFHNAEVKNNYITKTHIKDSKRINIGNIQRKQNELKTLKLQRNLTNRRKKIQKIITKQKLQINHKQNEIQQNKILTNIGNIEQQGQVCNFPKIVWIYIEQNLEMQSYLTKTIISNMAESLAQNGYELYLISNENFLSIISARNQLRMHTLLSKLKQRITINSSSSNIKSNYQNIQRQLISIILLSQNGGILIDKNIILTKNLSWLQHLNKFESISKGRSEKSNIFGFSSQLYSSQSEQVMMNQYENRSISIHPSINPDFLAVSIEGRQFMKLILNKYYLLLQNTSNPKLFENESSIYHKSLLTVIQEKQLKLDHEWKTRNQEGMRQLAIDYYGIWTMHQLYGPQRYPNLFYNKPIQQIYFFLTKVPCSQIARLYGNITFMTFIPLQNEIAQYLEQAQSGNTKYYILQDSFLGKYIYNRQIGAEFIIQTLPNAANYQLSNEAVVWKTLPKIIWLYSQSNIQNNIVRKLCLNTINHSALQSGFTIKILNQSNIEQYINISIINSINQSNRSILAQLRLNFIKLTILKTFGGVWIQLPLFTIQNLNWILDIHHNPYVINKIGTTPKVLMFYEPISSGFHWIIANDSSIKFNERLSYQGNFIAAEPNSYLITQWHNEFYSNLNMTQQDLDTKIRQQYKINSFEFIKESHNLLSYSLGYVLENENKQLEHHSNGKQLFMEDRCGLWVLNGFMGSQKLIQSTDYIQSIQINQYLWSHSESQATNLLGQFHYFVSMDTPQQQSLNKELAARPNTSHIQVHTHSLFYHHLYNPQLIKQILFNDKPQVAIQKEQIIQTIPKIVWLYLSAHQLQQQIHRNRYMNNILHYSEGYTVNFVNEDNYQQLISEEYREQMHAVLEEIDFMTVFQRQIILKIKKTAIVLAVLIQNGGIFIDHSVLLTEPLDWIDKISQNSLVDGGSKTINNVIGFFSANHNPQMQKPESSSRIKYPTLQQFFIATIKNAAYLNDLFIQYLILVKQKNIELINKLDNNTLKTKAVSQIELFYYASYLICKNKQLQSAIDFYGLALINSRYFPQKLNYLYNNKPTQYLLNAIGYISEDQLTGYIGPLSYMIHIPNHDETYQIISQRNITTLSLLAKHHYLTEDEYLRFPLIKKTNDRNVWKDLPKLIWHYKSLNGKQNQIESQNKKQMLSMANQAGMNVIQISKKNIANYISKEILSNITSVMSKVKVGIDAKSLTFVVYKLAILQRYGGVFMSNQFMPVDNISWIVNIGQDNRFMYNNYGTAPKVLTFFKPSSQYLYNYTIDEKQGIKANENITILNNFIAAVKNSEFIHQMLNQILNIVVLSDQKIKNLFKQYSIDINPRKVEVEDLISTVSKYLLAKRTKQLKNAQNPISCFNYYGIWSINEDIGPNKLLNLNISSENRDEIAKLSFLVDQKGSQYVNRVVGRPHFLILETPTSKKTNSQTVPANIGKKIQRRNQN